MPASRLEFDCAVDGLALPGDPFRERLVPKEHLPKMGKVVDLTWAELLCKSLLGSSHSR